MMIFVDQLFNILYELSPTYQGMKKKEIKHDVHFMKVDNNERNDDIYKQSLNIFKSSFKILILLLIIIIICTW